MATRAKQAVGTLLEIQSVYETIKLDHPFLLKDPDKATKDMKDQYNHIVNQNISDAEIRERLLI